MTTTEGAEAAKQLGLGNEPGWRVFDVSGKVHEGFAVVKVLGNPLACDCDEVRGPPVFHWFVWLEGALDQWGQPARPNCGSSPRAAVAGHAAQLGIAVREVLEPGQEPLIHRLTALEKRLENEQALSRLQVAALDAATRYMAASDAMDELLTRDTRVPGMMEQALEAMKAARPLWDVAREAVLTEYKRQEAEFAVWEKANLPRMLREAEEARAKAGVGSST